MKESLQVNGHQIEIHASIWNGAEVIKYDGAVVSKRRNFLTFTSFHSFQVDENGEEIVYEVQISSGLGTAYAVRRNGIVQGHKP